MIISRDNYLDTHRWVAAPENGLQDYAVYAERGISGIMPTSGLCRLGSPHDWEPSRFYAA